MLYYVRMTYQLPPQLSKMVLLPKSFALISTDYHSICLNDSVSTIVPQGSDRNHKITGLVIENTNKKE